MTPTQLKVVNTVATTVFGLTGLACLALAAYLALTPAPPKHAQYLKRTPDSANCIKALRDLGINAQKEGALIQAKVPEAEVDNNPKEYINLASVGIAACKLPLKAFCMGTACKQPGKPNGAEPPSGMTFSLDATDPYAGPQL